MLAALEILRGDYGGRFVIDIVDVDGDPALQAQYDELVPVLVGHGSAADRELCHYFLDVEAVNAHLAGAGLVRPATHGRVGS